MTRYFLAVLLCTAAFFGCEKEKEDITEPVANPQDFSIDCNDTIYFDNVKDSTHLLPFPVSITSVGNTSDFDISIRQDSLDPFPKFDIFKPEICPVNQTKNIQFTYTGSGLLTNGVPEPGIYPIQIAARPTNQSVPEKLKTIYAKVQPSCAFDYTSFNKVHIEYETQTSYSGTVYCLYTLDNHLRVIDVLGPDIILEMNCNDNTFIVQSFTDNGTAVTGAGTMDSYFIYLRIFANGNLFATALISK